MPPILAAAAPVVVDALHRAKDDAALALGAVIGLVVVVYAWRYIRRGIFA